MSDAEKRKFINPTPGWVGCTILNDDNKREGVPVEPGGFIWLSEVEERLTAEATRKPEDNPFVKEWDRVTGHDAAGTAITVKEQGMLVLSDEPARPVASSRFTPSQAARTTAETPQEPPQAPEEGQEAEEGEQHAADIPPQPSGPAPEGKPDPDEVVATPEAVAANDAELKAREEAKEKPQPVSDRPAGTDAIGVPPTREPTPMPV